MRKFTYYIPSLAIILFLLTSCYPMDDNYAWLVKDGPIVYLNRADSAVALGGRNKIKLKWFKEWDNRAVKAKVFWNGNKDSVAIDLSQHKTEYVISGLSETVFSFELFFYSEEGLRSCATSVVGRSYGVTYESLLLNRLVRILPPNGEGQWADYVQLVLPNFTSSGYQSSEIVYVDNLGLEQMVRVSQSKADTVRILKTEIKAPQSITYRSVYLPDQDGFGEEFFSKWNTVELTE